MRVSNTKKASPRQHCGFTLVEMLVVIAIVGLLVGLATPSFKRSQGESRLDGSAAKLASDIQFTRLQATKSGMYSFMLLDGAKKSWSIWLDADSSMSLDTAQDSLVKRDALDPTIRFGFGFSAPSPLAVLGTAVPSSGFGSVKSGNVEDCLSGTTFPAATLGVSTWAKNAADGLIVGCGGATADIGNGVLYLTTTSSENKAYAVVFNHVTSGLEAFAVRRYKWSKGGTWILQ